MAKAKLTQKQIVKKAEELNNSRPLNVWRVSKYPEVKSVINHLFTEMKAQGIVSKRYAGKYERPYVNNRIKPLYCLS